MLYTLFVYNGNGESTLSVLCPTIADVLFLVSLSSLSVLSQQTGPKGLIPEGNLGMQVGVSLGYQSV